MVLEATSHALSHRTGRLYPLTFSHAIVQTISREHLDFHQTLETYVDDKMNLVRQVRKGGVLIFCADHRYRSQIEGATNGSVRTLTYSVDTGREEGSARIVKYRRGAS